MECPENYIPIIPLCKKITGKWVGLILSRNQCQTMVSVLSIYSAPCSLYSEAKQYHSGIVGLEFKFVQVDVLVPAFYSGFIWKHTSRH